MKEPKKLVIIGSAIASVLVTSAFSLSQDLLAVVVEHTSNGTKTIIKNSDGTIQEKWIGAVDGTTIYKPAIFWRLTNSNWNSYVKIGGYSSNQSNPGNVDISWSNGLQLTRISGKDNAYTTVFYSMGDLFKKTRNLQISYDVIFKDNAKWGGIDIGDKIFIDVNPSRVGFRGPEVYGAGISVNEIHHVDIFINESLKNVFKVKVYVDNKEIVNNDYTIPDFASMTNLIGIRSPYYKGTEIVSNMNVITQDMVKISSAEQPIHEIFIDNNKEKYKYTYNGYYKPFGPNRGYWNVELVGCVGDYSLTPTANGGQRCEMWCTIGSSRIGYCKIK